MAQNTTSRPRAAARGLLVALPLASYVLGVHATAPSLPQVHVAPPDVQERTVPQDPQQRTAPFARSGRYLGKAACKDCHEPEADAVQKAHHRDVVASDALHGCETCHGPGEAHGLDADNAPHLITYPPKLTPAKQQELCGRCHAQQVAGHGGDMAGFLLAGKGCTDCHKVHRALPPSPPHAGVRFATRTAAAAGTDGARPVGSAKCVECHPLREQSLRQSHHRSLALEATADGCESCHGPGSLHVETNGLGRLITRPDRAADGVATCRSCHEQVDPSDFHWHGRRKPMLSAGLTCTNCHTVHAPVHPAWNERHAARRSSAAVASPAVEAAPTNAICARCHAPALSGQHVPLHQALTRPERPLAEGCAACHHGAAAHAQSPGLRALVDRVGGSSAEQQMQTCGGCHAEQPGLRHVRAGDHYRNAVACLDCHTTAARPETVRQDAEGRCANCHGKVSMEFRQPNRHPVPEGRMGCCDCHEPHAARHRVRDLRLREDACTECHKQYRGPFVFEHQAHRSDGCVVCHAPHGSSNRRLMQVATTQQLCLQCHADLPPFHDQSPGSVFRNCLHCHTEVHGSNHSRFLFR